MATKYNSTNGRQKRKGNIPLTRDELRARVGGINPSSLRPDSEERFELFEKIRKFYVLYSNGERLKDGLGEIVDWASSYGEYQLNERLKKEYRGLDLDSAAEQSKDERSFLFKKKKSVKGNKVKPSSSMISIKVNTLRGNALSSKDKDNNMSSTGYLPSEEAIREKLTEFYKIHDPGFLQNEIGFDRIVGYCVDKGVDKLNHKLQKKFGAGNCLNFNNYDSENEGAVATISQSKSKNQSFSTMLREAENERAEKNKPRARAKTNTSNAFSLNVANPAAMLSVAGTSRIQPSVAKDLQNKSRLPPQLKLFLKMYYSCYDPIYIVRDKLTGAKMFAEEVGMEKFDQRLNIKYKESLSEFQGRVELLQDKLQNFYLIVDLKRTNDALMGVLQWALRNGERMLNKELRRRYGRDLTTYDKPQKVEVIKEPTNVEEPKF